MMNPMYSYQNTKPNFTTNSNSKEISPDEDLFFVGTTMQCTLEDARKIKDFILTQTKARLIYQHRSLTYLKVVSAEANQP